MPRKPRRFPVTDPQLDAPDGAEVDGYRRSGGSWEKVPDAPAPMLGCKWIEGGKSCLNPLPYPEAVGHGQLCDEHVEAELRMHSAALAVHSHSIGGSLATPQPFESPSERRVFESFLEGRSEATRRAYKADLESFAEFTGDPGPETAIARLLASTQGAANGKVLEYRNHIRAQGLSPATVNRRLATLRSMVKLANMLGRVSWKLDVEGLDVTAYRDTAGPGLVTIQELLSAVEKRQDPKGKRDLAILRLVFDLGLRRGEVVELDIEHVSDRGISILGKGRTEREILKLPPVTRAAMNGWLAIHPGNARGALFVSLDPATSGLVHERLTGHGIYVILSTWSTHIDKKNVRPHGIRHTAITTYLEASNGNLRGAQSFARHRNANTTMRYDDNRLDVRGEAAVTVSRFLPSTRLATVPVSQDAAADAVVEIHDPQALLALIPNEPEPKLKSKKKVKWFT